MKSGKSATVKIPLIDSIYVKDYIFRGILLYFASLLNRGHLSKERICSSRSKFFPLRVDPIFKELCSSREGNRNSLHSINDQSKSMSHGLVEVVVVLLF